MWVLDEKGNNCGVSGDGRASFIPFPDDDPIERIHPDLYVHIGS